MQQFSQNQISIEDFLSPTFSYKRLSFLTEMEKMSMNLITIKEDLNLKVISASDKASAASFRTLYILVRVHLVIITYSVFESYKKEENYFRTFGENWAYFWKFKII